MKIVFLNYAANQRLNPDQAINVGELTLPEMTGLFSLKQLQGEMLPQTQMLGRWVGKGELRDAWESEFLASVQFSRPERNRMLGGGNSCACMRRKSSEVARIARPALPTGICCTRC